ncbi:hypothetical protein [Pedobacter sp.]|jgi:hypothetical protein|uniref:hypothetical protein n=1 Tax=Pedobacter sp. TaxID=1411316 RepID=UPI002BCE8E0E|nr:hypothetical protein [Pedobacter sp.]HWW41699.1 hypothetical protein [Pedobacter sp.]
MKRITTIALPVMLTAGLFWSSCKKTTHEIDYPFADIKSFTVPDGNGNKLSVAVDQQTLTLYWPGNTSVPDSISPVIEVSERARISPASGKKVALKDGLSYTVTAQNGTSLVYKLKVVNNQAPPQLNDESPLTTHQYDQINLNGKVNYLIPDLEKTKAYLVDGSGQEIRLMIVDLGRTALNLFVDTYDQTRLPGPGKYKLKIVTGGKSITSKTDFITIDKVDFAPPYIFNASAQPIRAKRGTRVTLPFRNLSGNTITLISLDGANLLDIVSVSADGQGLLVDIPTEHSTGEFYLPLVYYDHTATGTSGAVYSPRSISPIIITE